MNTLSDALQGAYAAHEHSERVRTRDPHRIVGAVRRRRRARAVGQGTATVAGVAAVGAFWWLAPGGRHAEPALPAPTFTCEVWPYVPPNPAALGDTPILFRAYIDLRADSPDPKVVVVLTDGTAIRLEPNDVGDYVYVIDGDEYFVAWHSFPEVPWGTVGDYDKFSGGGDVWDGVSPFVRDYAWTIAVPAEVPEGINTASLSSTLRIAMGMGGTGYLTDSVPAGAVTDAVVTTTTGSTEVTRLKDGDPGPSLEGRDDVASVALRVSQLPGDETFTIVATYDPAGIPEPVCVSDELALTTFTPAPVPPSPGLSWAPSPDPSPTASPMFGSSPSPAPVLTPTPDPEPSQG